MDTPAARIPPILRRSGPVIPHAPTRLQRIGARTIVLLHSLLTATLRVRWEGGPPTFSPQCIFALWHNRLGLSMFVYQQQIGQPPTPKLAALVSASRDGAFLSAVLDAFRVQPVRGSSSRRGGQALIEFSRWAKRGLHLAITPDGPRGPRYHARDGIIKLAQVTGLPIVPVSAHLHWKIQLKSWDRFQIPLPFSRVIFHVGPPLHVQRRLTPEQLEAARAELERRLRELTID